MAEGARTAGIDRKCWRVWEEENLSTEKVLFVKETDNSAGKTGLCLCNIRWHLAPCLDVP
jgi:hypothetical protein